MCSDPSKVPAMWRFRLAQLMTKRQWSSGCVIHLPNGLICGEYRRYGIPTGVVCKCSPPLPTDDAAYRVTPFVEGLGDKALLRVDITDIVGSDVEVEYFDGEDTVKFIVSRDELQPAPPESATSLRVGDKVKKTSGYPFPGTYRGSVWTSRGEERVIVEHVDGWLHIFNPGQIEPDGT